MVGLPDIAEPPRDVEVAAGQEAPKLLLRIEQYGDVADLG